MTFDTLKFWDDSFREHRETIAVIDGSVYVPGDRTSGGFLGMAGRRFDIEYFDGRKCTTHDLWSIGSLPDELRNEHPDNAKFRDAARVVVGGTTCWNPTPDELPKWPKPSQMKRRTA